MSQVRTSTPRVSVLLPIYNGAAFVGGAVESVLAQTFDDFELLVLDDCSPDESATIAAGFRDPRLRVLQNERNLGQVATLNRGLREARGEYVARIDQDDVSLPARFTRQVELLDAEPSVAVVGTWSDIVDDEGARMEELRTRLDGVVDAIFLILVSRLPIMHPSVMFRRGAVLEAGGYDEAVRYCEDMDLWRRLALAGHGLRVVPEPLLHYRVHGGQQSQNHWDEQQANNAASLERFVAALAPEADARLVRMAFTRQLDLWGELRSRRDSQRLADDLELVLAGAAARFGLTADEQLDLGRRVRAHVAAASISGWRTGVRRYWRTSPPLARFGAKQRGSRLRFAAAYAAAPALASARLAFRRLAGRR